MISIRKFEIPLVPCRERRLHLGIAEVKRVRHQRVGLGDQLHVGVLDAVVQHLDEMPAPSGPRCAQQGAPSTLAAIASKIGRTRA